MIIFFLLYYDFIFMHERLFNSQLLFPPLFIFLTSYSAFYFLSLNNQTQVQSGGSGRGLVVQDINAPPSIVWDRILDYDNYSSMVPKTVESKNYKILTNKNDILQDTSSDTSPSSSSFLSSLSQIIYTRMKVGFPLLKLEFFIKHKYYPSLNSLTWTLDYDKSSDFNDSCGYWYVIPHPHDVRRTRVYYSVEVSMFDWIPKFVADFTSSKALTGATAWVKKFSELEYEKLGGDSSIDDGRGHILYESN